MGIVCFGRVAWKQLCFYFLFHCDATTITSTRVSRDSRRVGEQEDLGGDEGGGASIVPQTGYLELKDSAGHAEMAVVSAEEVGVGRLEHLCRSVGAMRSSFGRQGRDGGPIPTRRL